MFGGGSVRKTGTKKEQIEEKDLNFTSFVENTVMLGC